LREWTRRITFEHAFIYAGKQINEQWAIVPCCQAHNSGEAMVKDWNRFISLKRAKELNIWEEIKQKYPKKNWEQLFLYLNKKYG
jgi:hypothetical protein